MNKRSLRRNFNQAMAALNAASADRTEGCNARFNDAVAKAKAAKLALIFEENR